MKTMNFQNAPIKLSFILVFNKKTGHYKVERAVLKRLRDMTYDYKGAESEFDSYLNENSLKFIGWLFENEIKDSDDLISYNTVLVKNSITTQPIKMYILEVGSNFVTIEITLEAEQDLLLMIKKEEVDIAREIYNTIKNEA